MAGNTAPNRLKALRSRRRWKLRGLAERIGVSVSQAQRIEAGQSEPSLAVAVAIERETRGAVRVEAWPSLGPAVSALFALRGVTAGVTAGESPAREVA